MRRDIQGVVLALVGATVLRLSFTDMMLSYVKPGMRPFLIASGAVLVVLGILSVFLDARQPVAPRAESDTEADPVGQHQEHQHEAPRAAWLLVLPVLLVFVVAPPALGAFSAERAPSALPGSGEWTMDPLPDKDPVPLPLANYGYRATWDAGETLVDRRVKLTGFVTPADQPEGWYLNRLMLNCCAADARVARVLVVGAEQPAADAWVSVVGRYRPALDAESTEPIPVIEAESVSVVPKPANPYE